MKQLAELTPGAVLPGVPQQETAKNLCRSMQEVTSLLLCQEMSCTELLPPFQTSGTFSRFDCAVHLSRRHSTVMAGKASHLAGISHHIMPGSLDLVHQEQEASIASIAFDCSKVFDRAMPCRAYLISCKFGKEHVPGRQAFL